MQIKAFIKIGHLVVVTNQGKSLAELTKLLFKTDTMVTKKGC